MPSFITNDGVEVSTRSGSLLPGIWDQNRGGQPHTAAGLNREVGSFRPAKTSRPCDGADMDKGCSRNEMT